MGNLFFSSQTVKDLGKLDIIFNTALRLVYGVRVAREVHTLDLYTKSNMFSLTYRRKYFMLNLIHRLIGTDQIDLQEPARETRQNRSPLNNISIPINDTVGQCMSRERSGITNIPTFVVSEIMNILKPLCAVK